MKPIQITLLTAAVILIAVSAIAIACAPAAPNRQSDSSTPTPTRELQAGDPAPTLAGTPPMIYLHNAEATLVPVQAPPTLPLTPFVLIGGHLQRLAEAQESTKQANIGKAPLPTPKRPTEENLYILISLDKARHINDVVDFIEEHNGFVGGTGRTGSYIKGPWISATIHPSLINELSRLDAVTKIEEKDKGVDASSKNQTTLPDLNTIHGVEAWHKANKTGQGAVDGNQQADSIGFFLFSSGISIHPPH